MYCIQVQIVEVLCFVQKVDFLGGKGELVSSHSLFVIRVPFSLFHLTMVCK